MSDDAMEGDRNPAKLVGVDAKYVGTMMPPKPGYLTYSTKWKEFCREFLIIYRQIKETSSRSGKYGWPSVRDDIMQAYDTWDGKVRIRDSRFSRNNLEHWVSYGREISDGNFSFVDSFVRSCQFGPEYRRIVDKFNSSRENYHAEALADLYQTRDKDELIDIWSELSKYEKSIFLSPVFKDKTYKQIALFVKATDPPCMSVTGIFCKGKFDQYVLRDNPRSYRVCHGYIVPISRIFKRFDGDEYYPKGPFSVEAVMHLFHPLSRGLDSYEDDNTFPYHTSSKAHFPGSHIGLGNIHTGWVPQVATWFDEKLSNILYPPRINGEIQYGPNLGSFDFMPPLGNVTFREFDGQSDIFIQDALDLIKDTFIW